MEIKPIDVKNLREKFPSIYSFFICLSSIFFNPAESLVAASAL